MPPFNYRRLIPNLGNFNLPMPNDRIDLHQTRSQSECWPRARLDCTIIARPPDCFRQGHKDVVWLFPDYWAIEEAYYGRTKVWPIMHIIAPRGDFPQRDHDQRAGVMPQRRPARTAGGPFTSPEAAEPPAQARASTDPAEPGRRRASRPASSRADTNPAPQSCP